MQKRPIILSILLTEATRYASLHRERLCVCGYVLLCAFGFSRTYTLGELPAGEHVRIVYAMHIRVCAHTHTYAHICTHTLTHTLISHDTHRTQTHTQTCLSLSCDFSFVTREFSFLTRVFSYRVAKTHRMPYLYRSFSAKEPYN